MASMNDVIKIKKKEFILTLSLFTPSDMNSKITLMPKVILEKKLSQKIYSILDVNEL